MNRQTGEGAGKEILHGVMKEGAGERGCLGDRRAGSDFCS